MSRRWKIVLAMLMLSALAFGFADQLFAGAGYNFERLHIFLFNLCSGGTIIIFHSEQKGHGTQWARWFCLLALAYALLAFLHWYAAACLVSLLLAAIVEQVRARRFSHLPLDLFTRREPVYEKFHHAALLCLFLGLVACAGVILNNQYLHLFYKPKLQLDTFFLGFSFPASLISMSVIFKLMEEKRNATIDVLKEMCFWVINLGVIIFFLFIIFEWLSPQIVIAVTLFLAVVVVLALYYRLGRLIQQKHFLTSGIGFLIFTSLTGIIYILLHFLPDYTPENYTWLLRMHSIAALYGWNLCGLAVICRLNDFPINLDSRVVILLHWLTVLVLAPLGSLYGVAAMATMVCYGVILYVMFFSRANGVKV